MADKREQIAKLAHSQWSGWMEYLFSKCRESRPSDGEAFHEECLIIPEWAVKRWKKQMKTPYCDLSEKEKDSDRAEADKFIAVMGEPKKPLNKQYDMRRSLGLTNEELEALFH